MFHLGWAFGLNPLEEDDWAFGVADRTNWNNERMYWDGIWGGTTVDWGPGDRIGMLLAQSGSCF